MTEGVNPPPRGAERATPSSASDSSERGVGDIVSAITTDVQLLVKHEIELAKAELLPSAKAAGTGAGLFGGAGVFALYALGLAFIGVSVLIGQALAQIWLGFLIMAGGLLIIAAILGLIGKVMIGKADFSATRTKAATTSSVNAVKGAITRATTAAKTPAIEPRRD